MSTGPCRAARRAEGGSWWARSRRARRARSRSTTSRATPRGSTSYGHQGATSEGLSRDTGLSAASVARSLGWLTDRRLLAELDGYHVALALRPRDELIANYVELSAPRAAPPRALQRAALPVYQPAEAAGAVSP